MFAVYGVNGQTFRGTLEDYIAVAGLSAARRARGIAREGEHAVPELQAKLGKLRREPDESRYQEAAAAYQQVLRAPMERGPILHAYQLMSRDVFSLRPDATVEAAWRSLVERNLTQAPVLDQALQLVGHISEHELLTVINLEHGQLRDVMARQVSDVMISPVVSADPVADIRRVARLLLEQDLPGMPVVNESHELVGLITRSDLLRALVNDPPLSLWA